jgi:hypothetical protein
VVVAVALAACCPARQFSHQGHIPSSSALVARAQADPLALTVQTRHSMALLRSEAVEVAVLELVQTLVGLVADLAAALLDRARVALPGKAIRAATTSWALFKAVVVVALAAQVKLLPAQQRRVAAAPA